jgi:hypothetical protein
MPGRVSEGYYETLMKESGMRVISGFFWCGGIGVEGVMGRLRNIGFSQENHMRRKGY